MKWFLPAALALLLVLAVGQSPARPESTPQPVDVVSFTAPDGYDIPIDTTPTVVSVTPAEDVMVLTDPVAVQPIITEDDPRWDCRTMGNHQCGVEVEGTWYVITFDGAGHPIGVSER